MVRIRLKRAGAKNQPAYRVVVTDSRSPRDGRFIEELGYYEPLKAGNNAKINVERADYWLKCGAKPSFTVASLIAKERRKSAQ
ncbi:MAG: 30S ribosomal protein S16 [Verrucomicrobia bacterium]|jgi:small subunit ribosomal protein S16|nr:30S ribosomal protein S16 [Verrucomicrobiota bacterium]MBO4714820.1 30S ribosomal protein S16 [Verrucomicrobiota bacterium]MBO4796725.1 30S ribosomal protein S16 [Verrucomicrobiota bacterium]MBO6004618.1 30S ribosomal protein S16 [Verrucomicrobiota bacterium]MBQ7589307.1 30S ribosomal protein S16 [Verrucomicrobiota bacterium]